MRFVAFCAGIGRKEADSETCELRSDRTRRRTSAFLGVSFGLARQLANAARRDGPFFGSGLIFRAMAHFRKETSEQRSDRTSAFLGA